MLRLVLAALVVANLAYFAFTRGALDGVFGLKAMGDREPERLAHQVRPQTIRLLPNAAPASAVAAPIACFETPLFSASEAAAVEPVLVANLPSGAWTDIRGERVVAGGRSESTHLYRIANADAALAAKVSGLKLDPAGRGFSACARAR